MDTTAKHLVRPGRFHGVQEVRWQPALGRVDAVPGLHMSHMFESRLGFRV